MSSDLDLFLEKRFRKIFNEFESKNINYNEIYMLYVFVYGKTL